MPVDSDVLFLRFRGLETTLQAGPSCHVGPDPQDGCRFILIQASVHRFLAGRSNSFLGRRLGFLLTKYNFGPGRSHRFKGRADGARRLRVDGLK